MDNTGNYVTYEELIVELLEDGNSLVSSEDTTLSNKSGDPGGDLFEYTGGTPQVNDILFQSGEYDRVIEVLSSPARVRVETADGSSPVANGPAKFARSSKLTKRRAESMIKEKSLFVDRKTRQFFNKRSGTFEVEGQNSPVLWFQVPIIEITKLVINSTKMELQEGEFKDFVAFKGREQPTDDRWNPRIKLNVGRGRDSIYTAPISNRVFRKKTLTEIQGSFGFLEPDGSTPEPIKRAVKLLVFKDLNHPGSTSVSSQTGPVRRKKVDLHEKEFFAPVQQEKDKKSLDSGIWEVDQILAMYRSPIVVGGSFRLAPGEWSESNYGATT